MKVSVVIPTFNRAALVCRAIDSALAQTHPSLEVIVVDDGSTDDTLPRLAAYGPRIRIIAQPNSGVCAARNAGIAAATGELIAFLDSDDLWRPFKIAAQAALFERHPDLVLAWTDLDVIDSTGTPRGTNQLRRFYAQSYAYLPEDTLFDSTEPLPGGGHVRIGDFARFVFLGNFFHLSTVMLRRAVLARVGAFDPAVGNAGEDYELFSRVVQHGRAALLDLPATICAIGEPGSLSSQRAHTALANWQTMAKIAAMHPEGLGLPADILARRRRNAALWAGMACFDEDRFPLARRHLAHAIALGAGSADTVLRLAIAYLPPGLIRLLRRAWAAARKRRQLSA